MKKELIQKLAIAATLFTIPTLSMAHTGMESTGLVSGLLHPLTGFDHLLAMIAVGLWAARMGGKALWALPITFVGLMILGAGLAIGTVNIPFVEPVILVSVISLGALVAFDIKMPVLAGTVLVALFGMMHGQAHGLEIAGATNTTYILGFATVTMALHLSGIALGKKLQRTQLLSIIGVGVASAGILMSLA